MELIEKNMNLFDCECDAYAHCISLDCAMGKGIAKEFVKKYPNMKETLLKYCEEVKTQYKEEIEVGDTILYYSNKNYVFNLITKEKYWYKPTYKSIAESIEDMKNIILEMREEEYFKDIRTLAIPLIGCGLDRLKWDRVKNIIEETFKCVDIKIIVCYL